MSTSHLGLSCILLLVWVPVSWCAPPTLTYLYPGGVQRGTTVEVTAAGTFPNGTITAWTNRSDVVFKPGKGQGKFLVRVANDALPGVCWVRVHDRLGASNLRPFMIGLLPEAQERETNDDLKRAHALKMPVTVNGQLRKSGDVDVFALQLQKGQTLVASMRANETLHSPMDGVLQVVSEKGFVLEQNDDHRGLDPQIAFTAPETGRYFVRTFAFPSTPTSSIRFAGGSTFVYRLTLTTAGFADHAYPLAVTRSAPGKVALVGWNIPTEASLLPVVQKPQHQEGLVFHPTIANAVSVRLEPHATAVEDNSSLQRVPVPVTLTGRIARQAEVDAYSFALKKGQRIAIQVEARTLHSPLDPVLRLLDDKGKVLKQVQPRKLGTDPELTVRATADTVYRMELHDLHNRGGRHFVYRVRLTPPVADFSLTVARDTFEVPPGKDLKVPVTITRSNGFKEKIAIRAEGLPMGVTANPVQASASSKAVTLILKGKGNLSGAFRIVGRTESKRQRHALAPIAGLTGTTEHLWITVLLVKPAKKK